MTKDEILKIMKESNKYNAYYFHIPNAEKDKAKVLCEKLNNEIDESKRRIYIKELFNKSSDLVFIGKNFNCDYGFNISFLGMCLINHNVTMLDTSPISIGDGVFIAPGVVISCAGHAIHPKQRGYVSTSKAITIEDGVWIGANSTILPGVKIGKGSIIGASSVVTKDIPTNVIACGNPCRVLREITDNDLINEEDIL